MLKNSLVALAVIFCAACSQSEFSNEAELTKYIADTENDLRYSKQIEGVDFELQYRPTDLMVAQEAGSDANDARIDSLRGKYGKQLYFVLSVSRHDDEILSGMAADKQGFGDMLQNLAFDMDRQVYLLSEKNDTLKVLDFVYPRLYGMTKKTSVLLAFERNGEALSGTRMKFVLNEIGLNTGEIQFRIKTDRIKNEPHLTFEK